MYGHMIPPFGPSTFLVKMKQMTDQEILIEQKKRELVNKQLQQKLKQHEDALTKMVPKTKPPAQSRSGRGQFVGHIHAQGFHGKSERLVAKHPKVKSASVAKPMLGKNNYMNDGNFMQQFMKMQGIKVPSIPTDIKGEAMSANSIQLTWNPPDRPNGIIQSYEIYYSKSHHKDTSQAFTWHITISPPHNAYLLEDLTPDTVYEISVAAKSLCGEGARGSIICISGENELPQHQHSDPVRIVPTDDDMKKKALRECLESFIVSGELTSEQILEVQDSIMTIMEASTDLTPDEFNINMKLALEMTTNSMLPKMPAAGPPMMPDLPAGRPHSSPGVPPARPPEMPDPPAAGSSTMPNVPVAVVTNGMDVHASDAFSHLMAPGVVTAGPPVSPTMATREMQARLLTNQLIAPTKGHSDDSQWARSRESRREDSGGFQYERLGESRREDSGGFQYERLDEAQQEWSDEAQWRQSGGARRWRLGDAQQTQAADTQQAAVAPSSAHSSNGPQTLPRASVAMKDPAIADVPQPRLCHLYWRYSSNGYGFRLQELPNYVGQFIIDIAPNSPAEDAGLKVGDRIVEVNGCNISNENHDLVIQRIKSELGKVRMLVVDREADRYFSSYGVNIHSAMTGILVIDKQGFYR